MDPGRSAMSGMTRSAGVVRLPWAIAVLDLAAFLVAAVVGTMDPIFGLIIGSAIASMTIVGAMLMTRAAGNRVGPLLLLAGTLLTVSSVAGAFALSAVAAPGPPPAGAAWANVLNQVLFIPPVVLLLICVPLIFPDGHLLGPRWRAIVWLVVAALAALTISGLLGPGPIGSAELESPIAIDGSEPFVAVLDAFASLTSPIGFGAAAAAVVIRFRRGRGVERQQLKWFLAVAAVCAIAFPFGSLIPPGPIADASFLVAIGGLVAMPVAIGIAILRYRLYEIDRLVSRTIAYAVVTGGLILVYLVVNLGLTTAFESLTSGNSVAVAASTLVVAALFTPLRRRVQRAVDHRFDRARYDGERTAAAFSERLRDEVDITTVTTDLDHTVRSAIAPTSVGIWLRAGER